MWCTNGADWSVPLEFWPVRLSSVDERRRLSMTKAVKSILNHLESQTGYTNILTAARLVWTINLHLFRSWVTLYWTFYRWVVGACASDKCYSHCYQSNKRTPVVIVWYPLSLSIRLLSTSSSCLSTFSCPAGARDGDAIEWSTSVTPTWRQNQP